MKALRATSVKTISFDKLRAMKSLDRRRDWDRLARKEITPEELQRENSFFQDARQFRILNLEKVLNAM